MRIRAWLAWWIWPPVMATSVAGALWGFERGYDPGTWSFVVSVANFNGVVLLEYLLLRRSGVSLLRDRQSLNDIGHGVVVAGLARPLAAAFTAGFVGWWAAAGFDVSGVWPHQWPLLPQVLLVLGASSLIGYWRHRLHFGEELLRFMVTPLPLLLMGIHPRKARVCSLGIEGGPVPGSFVGQRAQPFQENWRAIRGT